MAYDMTPETEKMLKKVGKIAGEVLAESHKLVVPGAKMIDVVEKLEAMLLEKGAKPAWPVNISINDLAAHYTPTAEDPYVFTENDVVKVDVGAQIDGYIADNATTVCLNSNYAKLTEAAEKALENAIKIAVPGTKIGDIGKIIQETIESYGYKPISNLCGHGIGPYEIHDWPSIPNVATGNETELEEGMVIAIEPFATDGAGSIKEGSICTIFQHNSTGKARLTAAKKIMNLAENEYETFPFAPRWIKEIPQQMVALSLNQLVATGSIIRHPILKEVGGGVVSQFEHTLIITKDSPIVTTRI